MSCIRAGLLLWLGPLLVSARQNPGDVLTGLRERVLQTVDRLPRYVCTETIDRSEREPNKSFEASCVDLLKGNYRGVKLQLASSDRLRLDVAFSNNQEMYSWTGANHFHEKGLFDLVGYGPISNGGFASFFTAIFRTDKADLSFDKEVTKEGRKLYQFQFQVPLERSHYSLGSALARGLTAYEGSFLVDPATFDLIQLMVRTHSPPTITGVCEASTILDYRRVHLNNGDFLLPLETRLRIMDESGQESNVRTVFSGCHEFLSRSTLIFEPSPEDRPQSLKETTRQKPSVLPSQLPFTVALTQDINTGTAAAGDPISAKLTTPIRNRKSQTLVRPGAALTGRIIRLERVYRREPHLQMFIKLEEIDADGVRIPLYAREYRSEGGRSVVPLRVFGRGNYGIYRFKGVKPDYVIKRGFKTHWITMPPESAN